MKKSCAWPIRDHILSNRQEPSAPFYNVFTCSPSPYIRSLVALLIDAYSRRVHGNASSREQLSSDAVSRRTPRDGLHSTGCDTRLRTHRSEEHTSELQSRQYLV